MRKLLGFFFCSSILLAQVPKFVNGAGGSGGTIGSITGIVKATAGVASAATLGTDYEVGTGISVPTTNTAAAIQAAIDALPSGGIVVLRANTTYAITTTQLTVAAGQNKLTIMFQPGAQITSTPTTTNCAISIGAVSAVTSHVWLINPDIKLMNASSAAANAICFTRMSHYGTVNAVLSTEANGATYVGNTRAGILTNGGDSSVKFSAYGTHLYPYLFGDFFYGIYQKHSTGQMDGNNRNKVFQGVLASGLSGARYQTGTIAVLNGNTAVVGTGTTFTTAMNGFTMSVQRTSASDVEQQTQPQNTNYTVTFVDATHLTLNTAYLEANNATAVYRLFDPAGPIGTFLEIGDTTTIDRTDYDSWAVGVKVGGYGNVIEGAFEGNNGRDWWVIAGGNGNAFNGAYADNWLDSGTKTRRSSGSNGGANSSRANLLTASGGILRVTGDDAGSQAACVGFAATPNAVVDGIVCRNGPNTFAFGSTAVPSVSRFQNTFGAAAVSSFFAGDTIGRWYVTGGGSMGWSSNGTTADTVLLTLSAANTVQMTGGSLVAGNGAAVASATTTALLAGNVFHITGTTTITTLNTCNAANAGRQVVLIFDGVLTFTDGNNLKLAGNFVTTADDTITLHCDGTNWYEAARSVN